MSIELTATNLKNAPWETLQDIKTGTVQPGAGCCMPRKSHGMLWHGWS